MKSQCMSLSRRGSRPTEGLKVRNLARSRGLRTPDLETETRRHKLCDCAGLLTACLFLISCLKHEFIVISKRRSSYFPLHLCGPNNRYPEIWSSIQPHEIILRLRFFLLGWKLVHWTAPPHDAALVSNVKLCFRSGVDRFASIDRILLKSDCRSMLYHPSISNRCLGSNSNCLIAQIVRPTIFHPGPIRRTTATVDGFQQTR